MLILVPNLSYAQDVDPEVILRNTQAIMNQVEDYEAQIEIEVDVDFLRMPVKEAKMYFKQPDKIRILSDEFFMLPKMGMDVSINKLLKDDYSAIFSGMEDVRGVSCYYIKVIPTGKKPDIILANLWISEEDSRLRRVENYTAKDGNYQVDFFYDDMNFLPVSTNISFEVEKIKFPASFMGKIMEVDKELMKEEGPKTGLVVFRFSDYKVNTGIPDSFFDEVYDDVYE
jgi:outer membrane lipoprotein-sorting protein